MGECQKFRIRFSRLKDFEMPKGKPVKEVLKGSGLFGNLSDAYLEQLASSCRRRSFSKGAVILYQTELSSDLLIILSGKIKATLIDEKGDEIILSFFKEGEFLGEMSLFDNEGRSATITAEEDSEIAVLERGKFIDLLAGQPRLAIDLIVELAKRLRRADEMIESLVFLDVKDRLLREFSKIAESEGGEKTKNLLKIVKKTHQELSTRIGASREAISKCMKHLASKGIIREEEGHFLIIPLEKKPDGRF